MLQKIQLIFMLYLVWWVAYQKPDFLDEVF